ncbi:MAG: hypothetical protein HN742_15450 [Lentisphaerae bacterium]|jgi:hypothetical protein|nr:hypothetical protein [Lentisphaerota bacterium]MBT4815370.1 hypothetical protein [Lentisphaerota bacterium]MBT5604383.1 hypothetical protein [Lentisphaerota bacterium]MBT7055216.1 hypothetical protein [Lentisphaerota bacterium]MBT7843273.1 hypothetical protein [Lentisphaerota bacterium]
MSMRGKRTVSVAATLLMVLFTTAGCMKNKVRIRVNPDGSGAIVVSQVVSAETAAMVEQSIKQMQAQFGGMEGGGAISMGMPEDPFYNEKQLKSQASRFGLGVTFVKAKKVDGEKGRGSIALYTFEDINDVYIDIDMESLGQNAASGAMSGAGDAPTPEKGDQAIEFAFTEGETNTLKITVPPMPDEGGSPGEAPVEAPDAAEVEAALAELGVDAGDRSVTAPAGAGAAGAMGMGGAPGGMGMMMGGAGAFGLKGNESPQEMMTAMFKGMRFLVEVEVMGNVVQSNATFPNPSKKERFTLFEMDFDEMMESPAFKETMKPETMMAGPGESMALLAKIPGFRRETNSEVVIDFKEK